jgi:integrase
MEESFNLKRDADRFATKVEHDKEAGTYIDPERAKTPVAVVFQEWMEAKGREGNTLRNYRSIKNKVIDPYWKQKSISAVLPGDLTRWEMWLREQGYVETTIMNRWGVLGACFKYAVLNDYLLETRNPFRKAQLSVGRSKVARAATKKIQIPEIEEIRRIADAIRPEYRLAVWFMAGCGLRIGESLAVTREQIDLSAGILHVSRQVTHDGKTQEGGGNTPAARGRSKGANSVLTVRNVKWREKDDGREVPIAESVEFEIRRHLRKYGTLRLEAAPNILAGDYLFSNVGRSNIPGVTWWRENVWHDAITDSGVRRQVTPHWLRHYFASAALGGGCPVTDVAEWMGHLDPSITATRYRHMMPEGTTRGRTALQAALTGTLRPAEGGPVLAPTGLTEATV